MTQPLPNYLLAQVAALDVHPTLQRVPRGQAAPTVAYGVSPTGYRLARFGLQFVMDEQCLMDGTPLQVYETALEQTGAAAVVGQA